MISKRLFLILGGTVGGIGAVVSITPPQFGTSGGLGALGGKSTSTTPAPVAPAQTSTAVPVTPTQKTPTTTTKKKKISTPTPAQQTAVNGIFTGSPFPAGQYGPVQVSVTVSNGMITQVSAPVYPNSPGQDRAINSQAIPLLIQEVMQAQSANIQGVGGASWTSQGFYNSLVSALKKAGI